MNQDPLHAVTDGEIAAFRTDGAAVLRRIFDRDWIDLLATGIERNMAEPGRFAHHYTAPDQPGLFFGDYCNWQRIEEYRRFMFDSPAGGIAARMMGSHTAQIFHEHVLVKEASTADPTPWHHDQPYWTVDGTQVCSLWIPLDPIRRENCVEFVAGSHRWGKWFTPRRFVDDTDHATEEGEAVPDIDAHRGDYTILGWNMEPGDCIVFHALTLHGAPGNTAGNSRRRAFAARWTGDDARFARRAGYMSPPFEEVTLAPGSPMDPEIFPVAWPRTQ